MRNTPVRMKSARVYSTAPTAPEDALHARGVCHVAGVDEAGRGPLAGPVVAAAVVFAPGTVIEGVTDSKKIPAPRRALLAARIKQQALAYGFGIVEAPDIDRVNILQATLIAMAQAVDNAQAALGAPIGHVLVDGNRTPPFPYPATCIIKGDEKSHCIAAAAILAKEARDAIMDALDAVYPIYGFAKHAGYGTRAHFAALAANGPCPAHRLTFRGVQ